MQEHNRIKMLQDLKQSVEELYLVKKRLLEESYEQQRRLLVHTFNQQQRLLDEDHQTQLAKIEAEMGVATIKADLEKSE